MKIKHSINFGLRPYGTKRKRYQIRMRASFNCQRIEITTGCNIDDPEAWDKETQQLVPGYRGRKGETTQSINDSLRRQKEILEHIFKDYEMNETVPTPKELSTEFSERINRTTPKSLSSEKKKETKETNGNLFGKFNMFVEECGKKNAWKKGTFRKMETLRSDLANFKQDLSFSDLSEKTLTEFVSYLRDSKKLRKPRKGIGDRESYDVEDVTGLTDSTINKKLGLLRWFLKWATDCGYNPYTEYKSFKPRLKKTPKKIIYLTREEIGCIKQLVLTEGQTALEQTRDILLFCCFSGLRHSNVYNLRRTSIKDGYFEINTAKDSSPLQIELNNTTRSILAKYENEKLTDGKALPVIQGPTLNKNLKILCRLAGIDKECRIHTGKKEETHPKWELVSSDTGHHTFIINAITKGIPASIILKWTGLKDLKTLEPYYDIVGLTEAEEMQKLNDF